MFHPSPTHVINPIPIIHNSLHPSFQNIPFTTCLPNQREGKFLLLSIFRSHSFWVQTHLNSTPLNKMVQSRGRKVGVAESERMEGGTVWNICIYYCIKVDSLLWCTHSNNQAKIAPDIILVVVDKVFGFYWGFSLKSFSALLKCKEWDTSQIKGHIFFFFKRQMESAVCELWLSNIKPTQRFNYLCHWIKPGRMKLNLLLSIFFLFVLYLVVKICEFHFSLVLKRRKFENFKITSSRIKLLLFLKFE